jgi:hypothetical protein
VDIYFSGNDYLYLNFFIYNVTFDI